MPPASDTCGASMIVSFSGFGLTLLFAGVPRTDTIEISSEFRMLRLAEKVSG